MIDIELFAHCAWATDQARNWNRTRGRGILYRGWAHISDSERFFPNEIRRKVVAPKWDDEGSRGFTWGT